MKLGIPQIIYLFGMAMTLGMHLIKHGERECFRYNFFIKLLICGINVWILYLGGFFK